jgi:NADH-quinone oxidoreductase subunit M
VVQVDVQRSQDLLSRELWVLIVPALLVLLLGLMPQGLLENQSLTVIGWLQRVEQPQWLLVKN